MRLRKPCSHNLYDAHEMSPVDRSLFKGWTDGWCPGGEFLPEDAGRVWWCEVLGEAWDMEIHDQTPCARAVFIHGIIDVDAHAACGFKVLAVQVGEPG